MCSAYWCTGQIDHAASMCSYNAINVACIDCISVGDSLSLADEIRFASGCSFHVKNKLGMLCVAVKNDQKRQEGDSSFMEKTRIKKANDVGVVRMLCAARSTRMCALCTMQHTRAADDRERVTCVCWTASLASHCYNLRTHFTSFIFRSNGRVRFAYREVYNYTVRRCSSIHPWTRCAACMHIRSYSAICV